MKFQVLGPVEVWDAGGPLELGHARQRAVLAVLVIELNRALPADRLIERVWGEALPGSGRSALYPYVAKIKGCLAAARDPRVRLTRTGGGYRLEADAATVDLCQFRRHLADAAREQAEPRRATLLRAALDLWRGEALAGLTSPWLRALADTLEAQRVTARLDLNDLALRSGQHERLCQSLVEQAGTHPADERLLGQLMLALHRSGRQAEALRWFERARQRLAEDLGADPGSELRLLHQRILRMDPVLTWTAGPVPTAVVHPADGGRAAVPRELPAPVRHFVGRSKELAALTASLEGSGAGGRTLVISAIGGTAGVGKTALAVRWGHDVADRFPDGQLYVNLRGYDPARPMTATDALASFLRSLGLAGEEIPADAGERAARYRSLLAGRRMLVVLDNARDTEQVRPLLPGDSGCVVVVTSRDSLQGLVARDGAVRLDLDVLPPSDTLTLLRGLIGARVDEDYAAAAALADSCAQLPLAVRVAAELVVGRPATTVREMADELVIQQRRLDLLGAGGDPRAAVSSVFSWSYEKLPGSAARAFRLLGLHPGTDFDSYAVAALAGGSLAEAEAALATLARAYLIQPLGPRRHTAHDLLRAYARDLTHTHDGRAGRHESQTRLFDYYLHTAATAMDVLHPAEAHLRPRVPPPDTPIPPLADETAAEAWFNAEWRTLIAITCHAAAHGWHRHAVRLGLTIGRHLETMALNPELVTVASAGRAAAESLGDEAAAAEMWGLAAVGEITQSLFTDARRGLERSRALHHALGNRLGEGRALGNLGSIDLRFGRYQEAEERNLAAITLFREAGERVAEARAVGTIGLINEDRGRYELAARQLMTALELFRAAGDPHGEAYTLARLAGVEVRSGHFHEAATHLARAEEMNRVRPYAASEAYTLLNRGLLQARLGERDQARARLEQAARESRPGGVIGAEALRGLGELFLADDDPSAARECFIGALAASARAGLKYFEACALEGLASACEALGSSADAARHRQRALLLHAEMGTPEADRLRQRLGQTAGGPAAR